MGDFLNIQLEKGIKIAVIGDIHEHEEQFDLAIKYLNSCNQRIILICSGDVYDKGFGQSCADRISNKLRDLMLNGRALVIPGNHELKHIKKSRSFGVLEEKWKWWSHLPLSISLIFKNNTRLTIVHAGVKPNHSFQDLSNNVEICFIRYIDESGNLIKLKKEIVDGKRLMIPEKDGGIIWHEKYDGRFGYIISGHNSQKDGKPKFYNYSSNIDTACYHTGKLTMQIFGENGSEELLEFCGEPKYPDLEDMYRLMAEGKI